MGVIDAAEQHHFGRSRDEPLGREFAQQCDGIVVQLSPTDGIQIAEQIDHVRMPGPPQVVRQCKTLVVEGLVTYRTGS